MKEAIIELLKAKGELGEFIGEGNDRVVYEHLGNKNLVIKIPKSTAGVIQNEWEGNHYLEEEKIRIKMGMRIFPNGLARCAYSPKDKFLYMQKLKVTEGSDFGVDPTGIIRRFDLNISNM